MTLRSTLYILVSTVCLIAAAIGLNMYAGLEASLLWAGLIGAIGWAIRSTIQQKQEYQRLLAERKRQHYLEFLEFLNTVFAASGKQQQGRSRGQKSPAQELSINELRKWSLRLTLIGSDDVVRAYNQARLCERDDADSDDVTLLRAWGEVWLAMRRDCGHIDTNLSRSEVLASIVNDISGNRDRIDQD